MSSIKYSELYEEMQKIIRLSDSVPSEFKNRVFQTLLDSLLESERHNPYEEQIITLTKNGDLLREFINKKNPQSNIEKTFLFVYYLERILGLEKVVIDHIESCYSLTGFELPKSISQNLRDIVKKYRYLKSENNGFKISEEGDELYHNKFIDKSREY